MAEEYIHFELVLLLCMLIVTQNAKKASQIYGYGPIVGL